MLGGLPCLPGLPSDLPAAEPEELVPFLHPRTHPEGVGWRKNGKDIKWQNNDRKHHIEIIKFDKNLAI